MPHYIYMEYAEHRKLGVAKLCLDIPDGATPAQIAEAKTKLDEFYSTGVRWAVENLRQTMYNIRLQMLCMAAAYGVDFSSVDDKLKGLMKEISTSHSQALKEEKQNGAVPDAEQTVTVALGDAAITTPDELRKLIKGLNSKNLIIAGDPISELRKECSLGRHEFVMGNCTRCGISSDYIGPIDPPTLPESPAG